VEGLLEIVVGAGVQAGDTLRPAAAGRQQEYRKVPARGAPALQHLDACQARQADIEHRRVEVLRLAHLPSGLAVGCRIDGKPGLRQTLVQST
jgi:hypothetical protein